MRKYIFYGAGVFFLMVAVIGTVFYRSESLAQEADQLVYEVEADYPRLNREVTGEVINSVMGVPAEPVDSFVWDGEGTTVVEGSAKIEINPVQNTGEIKVEWTDEYGDWTLTQSKFSPPPHPTGLRVGPDASNTILIEDDPVTTDVYLHGNTTAGGPVLPTVFNLITTWGPAKVTLDGEDFNNPFDGPTPLWVAHSMTSVGVRNEDGTVRTVEGEIFNPLENPANGAVDYDDLEFHIVFHDVPGPETENFPPPLSFFYHLTFEDVKVEITH